MKCSKLHFEDSHCRTKECFVQTPDRSSARSKAILIVLLSTHATLLAFCAWTHSPNLMEVVALPAGLSHWKLWHFERNRVNPPLVRMIAAIPVLFAEPRTDWPGVGDHTGRRSDYSVGHRFVKANGSRSFWLFMIARWACIPFSLCGAYFCFRWATELYGARSGTIAAILWCFSPNILGLGQFMTPDVPCAAAAVAASYAYFKWLKHPIWRTAVRSGVFLGIAQLLKMTLVILFIVFPAIYLWRLLTRCDDESRTRHGALSLQLAAILLFGLTILNLGFGFRGSFRSLGSYRFVSRTLGGHEAPVQGFGNRFNGHWYGRIPVPLPKNYLLGADAQKRDFENPSARASYLRGQWASQGWWYYYLYGLAIKVPLGTWGVFLCAMFLSKSPRIGLRAAADEASVIIPLVAILAFVSSQSGIRWHFRYVVPVLPFAFVLASRVARPASWSRPLVRSLTTLVLVWSGVSTMTVYPHSLSYFNELVGGPRQGHWHMLGSSIDWGQDLFYLKRWIDAHPEAHSVHCACRGPCNPRLAGIDTPGQPPSISRRQVSPLANWEPGWFAVSVEHLHRRPFSYFLDLRPVATGGYSIYIYHVTCHDVSRIKARFSAPVVSHVLE